VKKSDEKYTIHILFFVGDIPLWIWMLFIEANT